MPFAKYPPNSRASLSLQARLLAITCGMWAYYLLLVTLIFALFASQNSMTGEIMHAILGMVMGCGFIALVLAIIFIAAVYFLKLRLLAQSEPDALLSDRFRRARYGLQISCIHFVLGPFVWFYELLPAWHAVAVSKYYLSSHYVPPGGPYTDSLALFVLTWLPATLLWTAAQWMTWRTLRRQLGTAGIALP